MNTLATSPYLSLEDTAAALRNGDITSAALVENQLARITHTVGDAALLLDVIAGPEPRDPASAQSPVRSVMGRLSNDVKGTRVWLLPVSERHAIEHDVLARYDRAVDKLAELGMQPVARALPQSLAASMRIAGSLMSAEGYANLGELFEQDLEFDENVRRRILAGRDIDSAKYITLVKLRDQARLDMSEAMDGVDVCFLPTNAITAIPVASVDEMATPLSRFGRFANLLDLCSVAVQAGLSRQGLPISVQFVGRPCAEPLILQVAQAYERATPWHQAVPAGLG